MKLETNGRDMANVRGYATAWPVLLVLAIWLAIVCISCWRYQPLDVISADAPADEFSAERAEVFFERLYRDAKPHPAGNNQAFRQKVISEFEGLGYRVQTSKHTSNVNSRRSKAKQIELHNLLTTTDTLRTTNPSNATSEKPLLMLAAHFDSHPAGPGASDDGVALSALLEIARMLRDSVHDDLPTVAFLISDGEEFGLLGAKKFVEFSPLANENTIVINLEARGTTGPSLMFETSEESWWLINEYAKAVRKPATSSLFFEIYRFLPNSTDFTEFRTCGMRGFNFAFIGDVKNYHTPDDNFENADRRSMQHHGENAWRLIQRLRRSNLELPTPGRAVYFDFFNLIVVRWLAGLSLPLSLLGFMLIWLGSKRLAFPTRPNSTQTTADISNPTNDARNQPIQKLNDRQLPLWLDLALPLLLLINLLILGKLVELAFWLDAVFDTRALAQPVPVQSAFWFWNITLVAAVSMLLSDRVSWSRIWTSHCGLWGGLAIASSIWISGASYLFVVPILLLAIISIFTRFAMKENRAIIMSIAAAISVGLIWLPMERLFYDALGFRLVNALVIRVALVTGTLFPLMMLVKRESLLKLTFGLAIVSGGLTLWSVLAN